MISLGIDLGGSKIEAQIYDADFALLQNRRVVTPQDYDGLVAAMADMIGWARATTGIGAVGVAAAGLVNPDTGAAFAVNLPVSGQRFPSDIAKAAGCAITYLNDARAFTLSEAIFGAGRSHRQVAGLVLGTGVGGGMARDGSLVAGLSGLAGEIGHTAAPADWHDRLDLPVLPCGCGQRGCVETYLSGPGLVRLAQELTGQVLTPAAIVAARHDSQRAVWAAWCDLAASLLRHLVLMHDPDVIVLGGGLSQTPDIAGDLTAALRQQTIGGFPTPPVVQAQGGAASGGRGAAYAARQTAAAVQA